MEDLCEVYVFIVLMCFKNYHAVTDVSSKTKAAIKAAFNLGYWFNKTFVLFLNMRAN